jgi:hypothetical protein
VVREVGAVARQGGDGGAGGEVAARVRAQEKGNGVGKKKKKKKRDGGAQRIGREKEEGIKG